MSEVKDESVTVPEDIRRLRDQHEKLDLDPGVMSALRAFEKSIEKLDPESRNNVVNQHEKLAASLNLMRQKLGEILSTEQGLTAFERELEKRQDIKSDS